MSNQHAGSKSSDGDIGYFILFTIAVLAAGYFWILYGQIVSLFVASGKIEFVSPDMFDSLFQGLF